LHVGPDLCEHAGLRGGECKREQLQQAGHQEIAAGGKGQGRGGAAAQLLTPLPEGELQEQKFIKHQAATAGLQVLLALGLVDAAAGAGQGKQIEFAEQGWVQGIPPALAVGQNAAQEPGDPLLTQALAEGVHGHDPADPLRAHGRRGSIQHLDQGIAEGRAIGGLLHQTTDRHAGAHRVLVLLEPECAGGGEASARQEARHPQAAGAVV
jgi:hypothetical protein